MEANVIHEKDEGIIEMKRLNVTKRLAGFLLFLAVFGMTAITGFAAEGKVIPKTAKIRAQASMDSEVVASTTQGKTIDIQGAVKDAAGTVWYQVPISGGGHGYIRSDLVETSDKIKVSETTPASSDSSSSGSPAETVPTAIGETPAVIKSSQNVRVRNGASTQHSAVGSLPNGTAVTLIGEATDNSGTKWYQITCNYNGKTVEGYVRWDLVEAGVAGSPEGGEGGENPEGEAPEGGEGGENPEGEAPEGGEGGENPEGEAQPAPEPEHNDYEIVYAQNDTGEYEYYLYNNIEGNRQKLNELLTAVGTANENNQKLQDRVDNGKIIIIVLAVVIVLLFIAVTALIFKVRSLSYDYEYEEEEEEEEEEAEEEEDAEEEEAPVRKRRTRRAEAEEEEEAPARRRRTSSSESRERSAKSGERPARQRAKSERELYAAEAEPARKPASRKPQNFLIDDDEFEFEFLNMDDKDL